MSGGVDSAVAALSCAQSGRDGGGDARAVGRPRERRRAQLLLGVARSRRRARSRTRMGLPHFTIDLRDEFRAGVVDPFIAGYASRRDPEPLRRLQRPRPPRRDARARRPPRVRGARHRPLRPDRRADDPRGPLLRVAADPAKDQTYMLAALAPRVARADALPARGADEARGATESRPPRDCRWPARPTRRTSASWREPTAPGFSRATAGSVTRAGEIVDQHGRRARAPPRPASLHRRAAARHRGRRPASRCTCSTRTRPATACSSGRVGRCATSRVAIRGARLHRDGARVDRVKLRYRSRAAAGAPADDPPAGRHRIATIELERAVDGAAPGQLACLMDGELVVGWGTITRAEPGIGFRLTGSQASGSAGAALLVRWAAIEVAARSRGCCCLQRAGTAAHARTPRGAIRARAPPRSSGGWARLLVLVCRPARGSCAGTPREETFVGWIDWRGAITVGAYEPASASSPAHVVGRLGPSMITAARRSSSNPTAA